MKLIKEDIILLLFLLVFVAVASFFIGKNINPDEGTHLVIGVFFRDLISDWIAYPTLSFSKIYDYAISYMVHYPKLSLYYPPALYILIASITFITGMTPSISASVVLLFGIGTIFMIYYFGKKFINAKTGLIAAIIFGMIPQIFYLSIKTMLDMPFLFFFMLSLIFYMFAIRKGKTKFFLLMTISITVGFYFKENIIIIAPIIFAYNVLAIRKYNLKLILSLMLVGLLILPYLGFLYTSGLLLVMMKSSLRVGEFGISIPQIDSIDGWFYNLQELGGLLTYPILLIGLLSLIYYSHKRERYWKLFFLWFFVAYVLLTLIPNKQGRYLLPIIPTLMFPLAVYISRFKSSVVFLIIVSFVLFFFSSQILPPTLFYETDYSIISEKVLKGGGNSIVLSDPPWFYTSTYIYQIAKDDVNKSSYVFRNCLTKYDFNEIVNEYGIRYIIDPLNNFKGGSQFQKADIIKTQNVTITIYENLDYKPQRSPINPQEINCNYICITEEWVCSRFKKPVYALGGE